MIGSVTDLFGAFLNLSASTFYAYRAYKVCSFYPLSS
jgi:hypothetical protein